MQALENVSRARFDERATTGAAHLETTTAETMMKPKPMTKLQERSILESPCLRSLVRIVLAEAESRDICDAIADVGLALEILRGRFAHLRCEQQGCADSPDSTFCVRCGELF